MGAVCSCLHPEDYEDYVNPNSSVHRNCMCLGCFVQNFLTAYASLFRRGEIRSIPSSIQGPASVTTSASLDSSLSGVYRSPPRPLPDDADSRHFCTQQRDGLVSRREKGASHSQEETEPLRFSNDVSYDSLISEDKTKEQHSKSSLKLSSAKSATGIANVFPSSEEEDFCPTCLEEYTPENPKIMTKCSHHYHLGCIYEWMERSENCPVCGKVMDFDET